MISRLSLLTKLGLLMAASAGMLACASGKSAEKAPELVTEAQPGLQSTEGPSKKAEAEAKATAEATREAVDPTAPRPFEPVPPMHVVSIPDATDPIVNIRLVFRSGSIDDPAGKEGLTNLTAALMEEGGTQSLTSAQLLEALFPLAAELSASTGKELTVFEGRVHRDHLDKFLPIFTDLLLAPRFDAREFERIRQNAINSIEKRLRSEDDETLGKVALEALVYEGHPYGHFTGGTVEGLKAITLEDVKAHAKSVYTQDRLIIGLGGATTPELESRVKTVLSKLPATGKAIVELPPPPATKGQALILPKAGLSTAISMGFPYSLRRGDPDFFEVAFAVSQLGEHRQFDGVLFSELREKRGLNYGDYAYAEHFAQEGGSTLARTNIARRQQEFTIWIRPVETQNAVFATRGAVYFLQRMLERGMTQEEFERTRGFLTGYTRLWEQEMQRQLGYAIDSLLYGTPNYLESYRRAMQKMTPQSVREAARKHLSVDKLNFAFVTQDAEALKKLLIEQPPTPHRYLKDGKPVVGYPTEKSPELLAEDEKIAKQPLPVVPAEVETQPVGTFMQK